MEKIIVNADDELRIEPQGNDTYALHCSETIKSVTVPKKALAEMVDAYEKIWNDLVSEDREDTPEYWPDPQITSRKKQKDENVTSPRVLCIRNDGVEIILAFEAFNLLYYLTKIIWNQEPSRDPVEYYINSEKHMLIIDVGEYKFSLVDERQKNQRVSFPLHVLAYLWSCFPTIIRDFQDPKLASTSYWADNTDEVLMISWDQGECNILKFGNGNGNENSANSFESFVSIRESTFRNMFKLSLGVDYLPGDKSIPSLTHSLSTGKSIDFLADGQYFRTLNERSELDTLPMAALDELLKKREEIAKHFRTGSGVGVPGDETIYWENDDYTIQAGLFRNQWRGIYNYVLRFSRRKDIILKNKWFFVITEETFTKLLDLYQQEKETKKSIEL